MGSRFQYLLLAAMIDLIRVSRANFVPNITYYLSEFPPFLGADIATSIPLSLSNGSLSLWLFGDTITGTFSAGQRTIVSMPRNSIGLFRTIHGVPQSPLTHFIRYATVPADSKHVGFWSPPEDSHWSSPHQHFRLFVAFCPFFILSCKDFHSSYRQVLAHCWC